MDRTRSIFKKNVAQTIHLMFSNVLTVTRLCVKPLPKCLQMNRRPDYKLNRQLALNLNAALRVAGTSRSGNPSKLRQADILRRTGMSRTTLAPLLSTTNAAERNPDLTTLQKLAQAIGVPLAFLLMTPEDWRVMAQATAALDNFQEAAQQVVADDIGSPEMAEAVLRRCKVHPERPPFGAPPAPDEMTRLEGRNEWRRRCSLVVAALAQPASRGEPIALIRLTALAASLANQMTPHDPTHAA